MADEKSTGSCLCGAVSYEARGEPVFSAHCCCVDCRKASGADHITAAFYMNDQVTISGDVAEFGVEADSGNTNFRQFCPKCGSRLFNRNSARPNMIGIQTGTMDDVHGVSPRGVVYASGKREWDNFNDGLSQFEKMPPPPPEE